MERRRDRLGRAVGMLRRRDPRLLHGSERAPMMWFTLTLVAAAILIAYWVWLKHLQRDYLADLARRVRNAGTATDPWEEPQIVATYGGIHDVEDDLWT